MASCERAAAGGNMKNYKFKIEIEIIYNWAGKRKGKINYIKTIGKFHESVIMNWIWVSLGIHFTKSIYS